MSGTGLSQCSAVCYMRCRSLVYSTTSLTENPRELSGIPWVSITLMVTAPSMKPWWCWSRILKREWPWLTDMGTLALSRGMGPQPCAIRRLGLRSLHRRFILRIWIRTLLISFLTLMRQKRSRRCFRCACQTCSSTVRTALR